MKAEVETSAPGAELLLPWDLAEWFDRDTLRQWMVEEVETLDWGNPDLADYLRTQPSFHPKVLLCVLPLAYALAVYESEEITRRCYADAVFQPLCGQHPPPGANTLIHFRRDNRGLLKWALAQLFKRAMKERLGEAQLPAGVRRYLEEAAGSRLDLGRHMDRGPLGD